MTIEIRLKANRLKKKAYVLFIYNETQKQTYFSRRTQSIKNPRESKGLKNKIHLRVLASKT
jgi:hypothetical protein